MTNTIKSFWLALVLAAPLAVAGFATPSVASEQTATTTIEELGGDDGNGSIIDERHDENEGVGLDDTGSAGGG